MNWRAAANGATGANALLRFNLFEVKDLALIEHAKKDRLAKLALQTVKMRSCMAAKIGCAQSLGTQLEEFESEPIPSRVWVLVHQTMLFEHHHQAMHGALVQLHHCAELGEATLARTIGQNLQSG
jgi:hypothetical protein